MLRIRGKSTSLICWEENRQIAEIAAGLIMSVSGICVSYTVFKA